MPRTEKPPLPHWLAQYLAAIRVILVLTLVTGLVYPLSLTAIAQVPGLRHQAQGSPASDADGTKTGSELIGQTFTDQEGDPLRHYFQSRPSNAGDGYDGSASGAGNQGAESVVDVLPTSDAPGSGEQSLLTQVCARSLAVAKLEDVDASRPFCTDDGVGAVLGVFREQGSSGRVTRAVSLNQACPARPFMTTYEGVRVECAEPGDDYAGAVTTPVRGDAPARPKVPADAVTGSGSGLDPHISPAYARLQTHRIAVARGVPADDVQQLVERHTTGRALGVLGEPAVNVLGLNLALDRTYPKRGA